MLSVQYIGYSPLSLILKIPSEWLSERKFLKRIFFIKESGVDYQRYIREKDEVLKNNKLGIKEIPESWKLFSIVRVKSPEEGYRLLKILAEIRLCEIMTLGFIFLAIVNIPLLILAVINNTNWIYTLALTVFFLFSIRALLQLKHAIRSSFDKGVLLSWITLLKVNEDVAIKNS